MITKLTQKESIIRIMINDGDPKRWWYPYEFERQGDIFIGYKAPTRICELALEYPDMIDSKMDGKFKLTRFRFDNSHGFLPKLPKKLKDFVVGEFKRKNWSYYGMPTKYELVKKDDGNMVAVPKPGYVVPPDQGNLF